MSKPKWVPVGIPFDCGAAFLKVDCDYQSLLAKFVELSGQHIRLQEENVRLRDRIDDHDKQLAALINHVFAYYPSRPTPPSSVVPWPSEPYPLPASTLWHPYPHSEGSRPPQIQEE
jgi:hypothetical protein